MDHDNHSFHMWKLVLISKWNSGNSAYHAICVTGLKALSDYSDTKGESLVLSNQIFSICSHPNGGELNGAGQTCFLKFQFFPYPCPT